MAQGDLTEAHLAELHDRAREAGVPNYRLLGRAELIEAIEGGGEGGAPARTEQGGGRGGGRARAQEGGGEGGPARRRRGRRGGRGRGGRGGQPAQRDGEREREPVDEAETVEVTGVLDRMPQGYGFLRLSGLGADEGDVYVSASQIRRCELRPGDEVSGPAREPRRGEHHRALVRVGSVNGQEPEGERVQFEDLTPVAPHRRIPLGESDDPLARAVDLLGPLAFGQRVMILAEPRSGRTTLLRSLASALVDAGASVRVLLADERPEDVTGWKQAVPEADLIAAPADQEPVEQVRAADLAIGHAKRRAEAGEDVVVIIDSLSRLALGYRDPARVKRVFGAGRELEGEGSGSLTVIATVLDSDERGEEVRSALETNENVLIRLDADLAAQGAVPSLLIAESRSAGEEELRSPEELEAVRALRAELSEMDPGDAAKALAERISSSKSNAELLG
jgi:transcription termination factor Rho